MKKVLIGLTAGFALGTGIFYTPKQQQPKQASVMQKQYEQIYTKTIPYNLNKGNSGNTLPKIIELTDESLQQYGQQLYKEMYNGECIDINKFLKAKDQIDSIYKEYGFEKAKILYKSLNDNLSEEGNACDFLRLGPFELKAAAMSSLSLEDFMKLLDRYDLRYELEDYLYSQNKETRAEYIDRLCENQENAFLDPIEANYSLCRSIANAFPEDVFNSTSIAQEVPEIALTSEYLHSLAAIAERYDDSSTDDTMKGKLMEERDNLGNEFFQRIANIVCERYDSYSNSENGWIKEFIALGNFASLAYRNLTLTEKLTFVNYSSWINDEELLIKKVTKQCGNEE